MDPFLKTYSSIFMAPFRLSASARNGAKKWSYKFSKNGSIGAHPGSQFKNELAKLQLHICTFAVLP